MNAPSPIAIAGIDHVVIATSNMEAMIRFYCELLGCHVERTLPEIGLVQLRAGASLVDLIESAPVGDSDPEAEKAHNMHHFCLALREWDEGAIRRFLAAGGVAAGEAAQRYGADGTGPSLYIADPDGNQVELKGPAGA